MNANHMFRMIERVHIYPTYYKKTLRIVFFFNFV